MWTEIGLPRGPHWPCSPLIPIPAPSSLLRSTSRACPPLGLTSLTPLALGSPPPVPPTRPGAPRRIWVTDRAEAPAPRAAVLAQVEENHGGQRGVRQPLGLGVRAARVLLRRPRPRPDPGPGQVVEPQGAPGLSGLLGARAILLLVHPRPAGARGSGEGQERPSEEGSSRSRGPPAGEHRGGPRAQAEPPAGPVQPRSHAARGAPAPGQPPGAQPFSRGPLVPRASRPAPPHFVLASSLGARAPVPGSALPSAKRPRDGEEERGAPSRGRRGSAEGAPSSCGAAGAGSKGSASSRPRAGGGGGGEERLPAGGFWGGRGRLLPPPRGRRTARGGGRGDRGGPSRVGVEAEMPPPPSPPRWLP